MLLDGNADPDKLGPSTTARLSQYLHKITGSEGTIECTIGGEASVLPSLPGLVVDDLLIALPLQEGPQLQKIIQLSSSENTQTKEKSISNNKLQLTNFMWPTALKSLIHQIAIQFRLQSSCITPIIDKLVIHEAGDSFPLFDHEKQNFQSPLFAKLVIQLPSQYTGGNLILDHNFKGIQMTDFGQSKGLSAFKTFFICFLNDIPHRFEPVTSGHRLLLVYDLYWGETVIPKLSTATLAQQGRELATIFQEWDRGNDFVVFPLEMFYNRSTPWYKPNQIPASRDELSKLDSLLVTKLESVNRLLSPKQRIQILIVRFTKEPQKEFYEYKQEEMDCFYDSANKYIVAEARSLDGGEYHWSETTYVKLAQIVTDKKLFNPEGDWCALMVSLQRYNAENEVRRGDYARCFQLLKEAVFTEPPKRSLDIWSSQESCFLYFTQVNQGLSSLGPMLIPKRTPSLYLEFLSYLRLGEAPSTSEIEATIYLDESEELSKDIYCSSYADWMIWLDSLDSLSSFVIDRCMQKTIDFILDLPELEGLEIEDKSLEIAKEERIKLSKELENDLYEAFSFQTFAGEFYDPENPKKYFRGAWEMPWSAHKQRMLKLLQKQCVNLVSFLNNPEKDPTAKVTLRNGAEYCYMKFIRKYKIPLDTDYESSMVVSWVLLAGGDLPEPYLAIKPLKILLQEEQRKPIQSKTRKLICNAAQEGKLTIDGIAAMLKFQHFIGTIGLPKFISWIAPEFSSFIIAASNQGNNDRFRGCYAPASDEAHLDSFLPFVQPDMWDYHSLDVLRFLCEKLFPIDQIRFCKKIWRNDQVPESIQRECIQRLLQTLMNRGFAVHKNQKYNQVNEALSLYAMLREYEAIDRLLLVIRQLPSNDVETVIRNLLGPEKMEGADPNYLKEYPDVKLYMAKRMLMYYVKRLKQERGNKPVENWRLPEATSDHPGLLAFLHADQQTGVIRGFVDKPFTGIADAREFIHQYQQKCFSCVLSATGRGKTAVVEVSKTKEWYKRRIIRYEEVSAKIRKYRDCYKNLGLIPPPCTTKRKLSDLPLPSAKRRMPNKSL